MGTTRFALAALGVAVLAALTAGPAGSARARAPDCGYTDFARPFLRWLDPAKYVLVPDGGFEDGAAGWTLAGGARVVTGNEPFHLAGPDDDHALSLPAGSSATSPAVCIGLLSPTLRFVAANRGSLLSPLLVEAIVLGPAGPVETLPLLPVLAAPAWSPTLPIPIVVNLTQLPLVSHGTLHVAFRFRAAAGGDWTIDDAYVDPYQGR